jgi:long-chain acyl-CoA synthetase
VEKEADVELTGTVPALLARRAASEPGAVVLRKKDRGVWKSATAAEVAARVAAIRAGLRAMGFGRGDCAAVVSETRPEAALADLAIQDAGGASVAIHPDDDAQRVGHILRSAGCRVVFVEGEEQLDKVLESDCPAVARIVIFDIKGLRDFADPRAASPKPDDPAVILFPPEPASALGRTLTHADIGVLLAGAARQFGPRAGDERLALLSMSDPTERVLGLYLSIVHGVVTNYLENPETAVENLQQLRPTVLIADAEAWERLHARISGLAGAATALQRILYNWAIETARLGGGLSQLADLLVLRAVRRELGMDRLRLAWFGDAAPAPGAVAWAKALGIAVRRATDPDELAAVDDPAYRDLIAACYKPI